MTSAARDSSNDGGITMRLMSRPHRSYFSSRGGFRSVSSAHAATGPPISAPTRSRCGVAHSSPSAPRCRRINACTVGSEAYQFSPAAPAYRSESYRRAFSGPPNGSRSTGSMK